MKKPSVIQKNSSKTWLTNYLEVLNAQENVLNTELDLVNNQQALLQSSNDLYLGLVGDWR